MATSLTVRKIKRAMLNSPNDCWERAGYTIESTPGKFRGFKRRIFDTAGNLILDDVGYDEEIKYCRENGLMKGEG